MAQQDEELLRPKQVSQLTTVPVGTLSQWRHAGRGPRSFRLGRSVVYRRGDVLRWMAEAERATAAGGVSVA